MRRQARTNPITTVAGGSGRSPRALDSDRLAIASAGCKRTRLTCRIVLAHSGILCPCASKNAHDPPGLGTRLASWRITGFAGLATSATTIWSSSDQVTSKFRRRPCTFAVQAGWPYCEQPPPVLDRRSNRTDRRRSGCAPRHPCRDLSPGTETQFGQDAFDVAVCGSFGDD